MKESEGAITELRRAGCWLGVFRLMARIKGTSTYSRAWRRKQVWWHRSGRGSGASKRRRIQRGPSASSRAVGEPRRPVEILVPPIAPAGTLSRP